MNRIDRITAILIQLQSKRVVKAQEIAERFAISLRTVYRDVRTLEEAGVPIIGEAGVGYSIMDGYRLPPVMFTRDEASAFLTAEKLVEKLTDEATAKQYKSAMYKVKSVLRRTEKDLLENLDAHIEVVRHRPEPTIPLQNSILPAILRSITEKRVMSIRYVAGYNEKVTERHIEPTGVCYMDNHWHVIAFCQLRNDYRDFRVDRITRIQSTSKLFQARHLTLRDYLQQFAQRVGVIPVVIMFKESVVRYTREQKFYYGFVDEEVIGNCIEMRFLTHSLEGMARWLLMFAGSVEIISPDCLRDEIRQLIGNLQTHFG